MLREWITAIPYLHVLGYVFAFFAAFLETLPAVGLFVPGQTVVVLAGFLAQQGILNLTAVVICAVIGAILGDLLGYVLGRKYGLQLFKNQSGIIQDMAQLLKGHTFKTLVLGRFNSLTRAFAPFAAGASNVRPRSFLPANILGGVLWGATWVVVGYMFGASYEYVSESVSAILLGAGTAFSVVLLAYYYLRKHKITSHRTTILLIVNILSLVSFSLLLHSVVYNGSAVRFDEFMHKQLPLTHNAAFDFVMIVLTVFREYPLSIIFTVIPVVWLSVKKRYRDAGLIGITMFGGIVIDAALKEIIMRQRPLDGFISIPTYSFPSGHALLSVLFFGGLVLTIRKYLSWKRTFTVVCMSMVALLCFSRIYLAVHWFSDILGGILLGLFWLSFVFLCNEGYDSWKEDNKRKMANK
jgi:membrane protein DedA with SNARE-associated domain/membrane-associated phospholipid phosphatase